jgi:phosphatidylglycerol:prolipoprotein diacylglycerol transferase
MHQVLFEIPFLHIPIYGFGAMLFLAFIGCVMLASWRAEKEGLSKTYIHDVALWVFGIGILGARITYMIQYRLPLSQFFVIWRGGLVFYGSFVGGVAGYGLWRAWLEGRQAFDENRRKVFSWATIGGLLGASILLAYPIRYAVKLWNGGELSGANFAALLPATHLIVAAVIAGALTAVALAYILVIRKVAPPNWKMMDVMAPSIALGLAIGRVGCFLNGCCFGNIACPDCPALHFPLSAPSRFVYVQAGYQTAAGFTTAPTTRDDPRTRVEAVDPNSPAAAKGVQSGDRIVAFNGSPNKIIVDVSGAAGSTPIWKAFVTYLQNGNRDYVIQQPGRAQIMYDDVDAYRHDLEMFQRPTEWGQELYVAVTDLFNDRLVYNWPHGEQDLELTVLHANQTTPMALASFTPRTLGLHPTQVYETISTLLILLLLSAYFPFRRHNGEIIALFMLCYSVHRFLNEMLRNDTDPVFANMTLSQNGSILVFATALILLVYLWRKPVQPEPEPEPSAA